MDHIRVAEDRPRYSTVPYPLHHAVRQHELRWQHIAIYAALDYYRNHQTGEARPGLKTLVAHLHVSRNTVKRLLRDLIDKGYLGVRRGQGGRDPYIFALRYAPSTRAGRTRGQMRGVLRGQSELFKGYEEEHPTSLEPVGTTSAPCALPEKPSHCPICSHALRRTWITEGAIYRQGCGCGEKVIRLARRPKAY